MRVLFQQRGAVFSASGQLVVLGNCDEGLVTNGLSDIRVSGETSGLTPRSFKGFFGHLEWDDRSSIHNTLHERSCRDVLCRTRRNSEKTLLIARARRICNRTPPASRFECQTDTSPFLARNIVFCKFWLLRFRIPIRELSGHLGRYGVSRAYRRRGANIYVRFPARSVCGQRDLRNIWLDGDGPVMCRVKMMWRQQSNLTRMPRHPAHACT